MHQKITYWVVLLTYYLVGYFASGAGRTGVVTGLVAYVTNSFPASIIGYSITALSLAGGLFSIGYHTRQRRLQDELVAQEEN